MKVTKYPAVIRYEAAEGYRSVGLNERGVSLVVKLYVLKRVVDPVDQLELLRPEASTIDAEAFIKGLNQHGPAFRNPGGLANRLNIVNCVCHKEVGSKDMVQIELVIGNSLVKAHGSRIQDTLNVKAIIVAGESESGVHGSALGGLAFELRGRL